MTLPNAEEETRTTRLLIELRDELMWWHKIEPHTQAERYRRLLQEASAMIAKRLERETEGLL